MQTAADTGVTLDAAQTEQYDGLDAEVKSLDAHLIRLRALEEMNRAAAAPLPMTPTAPAPTPIIQVRSLLPPGTAFTRLIMARVYGKGDSNKEIEYAKRWKDSTPEVELILRAAVAPGTTTAVGWAAELATLKPVADEFLEFVRPATLLGKITGMRRVPFNVTIATQTAGGTYAWVGQAAPKPVGKLTTGSETLGIAKCAGIIVITEELARVSSPSAEELVRNDMRDGIAAFLDQQFTDPAVAPVANVSPGSITNGVAPIVSSGTSPTNARTDIAALLAAIVTSGNSVKNAYLLMSETNAMALGFSATALAAPLFPGLGPAGGTAMSVTVLTSQVLGTNVVALDPRGVLYADDGGINIDVSREASVQMDSAPMNPADATTVYTSFWQNNLIGLRAERFINWKRAKAGSVQRTTQTYIVSSAVTAESAPPAARL
jgi:HK97 family phage major capsid protein